MPTYGSQLLAQRNPVNYMEPDLRGVYAGYDARSKRHDDTIQEYSKYVDNVVKDQTLDPVEKQRRLDELKSNVYGMYSKYNGNISDARDEVIDTIIENRKDPYWAADKARTAGYNNMQTVSSQLAAQGLSPLFQDSQGNYINDINSIYGSLTDEYGRYKPLTSYDVKATKQLDYEVPFHDMFKTIKANVSSLDPTAKLSEGTMADLIKGYFTTGKFTSTNQNINRVLKDSVDRYMMTPEWAQLKGRYGQDAYKIASDLASSVSNQYRYSQSEKGYDPIRYTAEELNNKNGGNMPEADGLSTVQVPTHEIYNENNPFYSSDKLAYKDGKVVNPNKWSFVASKNNSPRGDTPTLPFKIRIGNEDAPKQVTTLVDNAVNNIINNNPNITKEQAYNQVVDKLNSEPEVISGSTTARTLPPSPENNKMIKSIKDSYFEQIDTKDGKKWSKTGMSTAKVYNPKTGIITSGADKSLWEDLGIDFNDVINVEAVGMFNDVYGIQSGGIMNIYKDINKPPIPIYIVGNDEISTGINSNKKRGFANEIKFAQENEYGVREVLGNNRIMITDKGDKQIISVVDKNGNIVNPRVLDKLYGINTMEVLNELKNNNDYIEINTPPVGSSF